MIDQRATSSRNVSLPASYAFDVLTLAGIVFLASLFGILTRPVGFLAVFWPANAILLGMLVRHPRFATPLCWMAALSAYVAADLATGGTLVKTLWLTGANIAGVFAGNFLYRFVSLNHRRLREPQSVIILFLISTVAAFASALVGGLAGGVILGQAYFSGFQFWFVSELVNFIVVLPVALITPPPAEWRQQFALSQSGSDLLDHSALPVAALVLSMIASCMIGGPGAFAFPVPALLWCATSFSLFPTALLTLGFSIWGMMIFSSAGVPAGVDPLSWTQSIRLGLGMIAMAPLSVASVTTTRNCLLRRLQDSVDHDFLTRTLARGTLMERGESISQENHTEGAAVLVLDIDHFKSVNDRFGHAAGDRALVAFSSTVAATLRKDDLFGRTGGEEFCVVLPGTSLSQAQIAAERIRQAVERLEIDIGTGEGFKITVSGGLATSNGPASSSFEEMLTLADGALYKAKAEGRNRIVTAA